MPNSTPIVQTPNPFATLPVIAGSIDKTGFSNIKIGDLAANNSSSFTFTLDPFYPAVYWIFAPAATTSSKNATGFIIVHGAGELSIVGSQRLSENSTTADDINVTISSGVLTVAVAGTNAATETKQVFLHRLA